MGYLLSNIRVKGMGLLLLLQGMGVLMLLKGIGTGMGFLLMLMQGMGVLLLIQDMLVQLVTGEFLADLERRQIESYAYSHSFFYSWT